MDRASSFGAPKDPLGSLVMRTRSYSLVLALIGISSNISAAEFHCDGGDTECLIAAIHAANSTEEKDRIKLGKGVYEVTRVDNHAKGPNGLPSISSAMAIIGEAADETIIRRSATEQIRLFHVAKNGKLNLQQVTVENGYLNLRCGAAVYTRGYFRLDDAIVDANKTRLCGGGVYVAQGGIGIIDSSVVSNNESQSGGGIHSEGKLEILDSEIITNVATQIFNKLFTGVGGGIVARGKTTEISNSVVEGNIADSEGGGAWFSTNSIVAGHTSSAVEVDINQTAFQRNHAFRGGGIYMESVTIDIEQSGIIDNSVSPPHPSFSAGSGGGVYSEHADVSLANSTISGNVAMTATDKCCSSGGGVYARGPRQADPTRYWIITNSTIVNNAAVGGSGGGLSGSGNDFIRIRNSIVAGNVSRDPAAYDCNGIGGTDPFDSNGHNIVGVGTGCKSNRPGDLPVHSVSVFVDVIDQLANNGGATQTHALLPGSPAIDSGRSPCQTVDGVLLTEDQRGLPREADGNMNGFKSCDIGAYEYQPN